MNIIHEIGNEPQSGHGMRDGRTDGRSETNIPLTPQTTLLCGEYNDDLFSIANFKTTFIVVLIIGFCPVWVCQTVHQTINSNNAYKQAKLPW